MISNRPMIPMLTHVDNLGDINLDMTSQEQLLGEISYNTTSINSTVDAIGPQLSRNEEEIQRINQAILTTLIPTNSEIKTTVGTTADEDTATTVIGLLKSIANKLS